MNNYEDKSDFEISRLVARALGLGYKLRTVRGQECKVRLGNGLVKDYCNNPSDAWPIIIPTGMSIELAHPDLGAIGTCTIYNPGGADWQCDFDSNDDALRAAMICFLKLKDAQQ